MRELIVPETVSFWTWFVDLYNPLLFIVKQYPSQISVATTKESSWPIESHHWPHSQKIELPLNMRLEPEAPFLAWESYVSYTLAPMWVRVMPFHVSQDENGFSPFSHRLSCFSSKYERFLWYEHSGQGHLVWTRVKKICFLYETLDGPRNIQLDWQASIALFFLLVTRTSCLIFASSLEATSNNTWVKIE